MSGDLDLAPDQSDLVFQKALFYGDIQLLLGLLGVLCPGKGDGIVPVIVRIGIIQSHCLFIVGLGLQIILLLQIAAGQDIEELALVGIGSQGLAVL